MEIILRENMPGLGKKNSMVKVRPGYARNYLIPQKKAMEVSNATVSVYKEIQSQTAHKNKKIKEEAKDLALRLESIIIDIAVKADKSGKIFGSINNLSISKALKEQGIELDKKNISLKQQIKNIGKYTAFLTLHEEVECNLKINVHSS